MTEPLPFTDDEIQRLRLVRARALICGGDIRPIRVQVRAFDGSVLTDRVLPLIAAINMEV